MRVAVSVTRWVNMNREAVSRLTKCKKKNLCLACLKPFKANETQVRGCHAACARATYRAIEKGLFTDEERVEEGKWLAAGKRGPKPSNPVTVEAHEAG